MLHIIDEFTDDGSSAMHSDSIFQLSTSTSCATKERVRAAKSEKFIGHINLCIHIAGTTEVTEA